MVQAFLLVAVILFILAAIPRVPGPLVPVGLAFFAGSFLVGGL